MPVPVTILQAPDSSQSLLPAFGITAHFGYEKPPILIKGDRHRVNHLRLTGNKFNPESRGKLECLDR